MRKIIAQILIFCLVSSYVVPLGMQVGAVDNGNIHEAARLLEMLDIMTLDSGEYEKKVTRADFAVYAGNILGIKEYLVNDLRYYIDVPMDHWALNSINKMTEAGFFSVSENKLFRPDDIITVEEAVKVLLSMMDYGSYSEMKGGYPAGYIKTARELDLLDGVSLDYEVTMKDAALLIYNSMHIPIMDTVIYNSSGEHTYISKAHGETLMSLYKGVYVNEGQVLSAGSISVEEKSITDIGEFAVGNEIYDEDGINALEYLGLNVRIYFREDKSDENPNVFLITEQKNNKVTDISIKNYEGFDPKTYQVSYYQEDGTRVLTKLVEKGVAVIKNGEVVSDNLFEALNGLNKGTVRLIDSDKNNAVDVIIIKVYENIVVSYIDGIEQGIYDKYSPEKNLILSEEDADVFIYDPSGTKTDFEKITEGNLLTVYKSDKVIEIYICNEPSSGIIFGTKNKDGRDMISFGKVESDAIWYELDKDFLTRSDISFKVGASGSVIFDKFGCVAEIVLDRAGGMKLGYLIAAAGIGTFGSAVGIKMLTQDGTIAKLECADNIVIDGTRATRNTDLETGVLSALALAKTTVNGQVVAYTLNDEGKINKIDTTHEGNEDVSLYKSVSGSVTFIYGSRQFGPTAVLNPSTGIIFGVPKDEEMGTATDEDYIVIPYSCMVTSQAYDIDGYKLDEEAGAEDVIVCKGSNINGYIKTQYTEMMLVEEISEVLDKEGDKREQVRGWISGTVCEYLCEDGFSAQDNGIGAGDIVRFRWNKYTNEVYGIYRILYDYNETLPEAAPEWAPQTAATANDSVSHNTYWRCVYAEVYAKNDGVLRLDYDNDNIVDETALASKIGRYLVYDKNARSNKVYLGTINDIVDAKSTGGTGSYVFMKTKSGIPNFVIIYK